jgi:hypothetical protein
MKITISKKLLNAYSKHGKNPSYSLSFMLSSMDPDTCVEAIQLLDSFAIGGDPVDVEIDEKHIRAIASIFGSADAELILKLLWAAFLFPEI